MSESEREGHNSLGSARHITEVSKNTSQKIRACLNKETKSMPKCVWLRGGLIKNNTKETAKMYRTKEMKLEQCPTGSTSA